MQALITPEKVATRMPFLRLNSLMVACCCSTDISRSLDMPALPAKAMPLKQTATPNRITCPEVVWSTSLTNLPSKMGDRKSTRLNSSHLGISYAVFCLKNKKQKNSNVKGGWSSQMGRGWDGDWPSE